MKKLVSAIVIVLALAACGSSGGSGGITFSPATENCSSPAAMTETIQLPSSVKATDTITDTKDGKTVSTGVVSNGGAQQADGTWRMIFQTNVVELQAACAALTPGTHTEQILDSSGKVLAQGSITITR